MSLKELADRLGIIPEYVDQTGKETRKTSDVTRADLLGVMGVDAHDDAAAARALDEIEERERAALIEPVRVVSSGTGGDSMPSIIARRPPDARGALEWSVELKDERGERARGEGKLRGARGTNLTIPLPHAPALGYYTVRLTISAGSGSWEGEQAMIVVPPACPDAREILGGGNGFGVVTNLYTVRSARNWGAGDLTDLGDLLQWAAGHGAAFVGVNPLHALHNRGTDISPYSPVSRLFRNPLYLDVEAVPELAESDIARELLDSADTRAELTRVRESGRVEYERVMALKRPILRALHATYAARHRDRHDARGRDCAQFFAATTDTLDDFATFLAIQEHLERTGKPWGNWREWPAALRDPRSAAVRRFREEHAEDIDFHRWVQFEIDCQLATAQSRAKDAGMPIGLYQDLAIGSSAAGSDPWVFPELFASGACVGAPPDEYSATGQNWGLPPIDPHALRRSGYRYWIALVRSALRHAGALRIDHVMGLFRQFWIPDGKSGKHGAYVRFPSEEILGILALESTRANALVVGEDLGTVPPDVPPALQRWKILSSKVLYFERENETGFKPASTYDDYALATANTHDMPTLEGFWGGRDIELRASAGLLDGEDAVSAATAKRREEKQALLDRLAAEGVRPPQLDAGDESCGAELRGAVHEFLCRTPSVMVGLALDDLVGEVEPVNLPGVGPDKYPSWSRRLSLPIEALDTDPGVRTALRCSSRGQAPERHSESHQAVSTA